MRQRTRNDEQQGPRTTHHTPCSCTVIVVSLITSFPFHSLISTSHKSKNAILQYAAPATAMAPSILRSTFAPSENLQPGVHLRVAPEYTCSDCFFKSLLVQLSPCNERVSLLSHPEKQWSSRLSNNLDDCR